MSKPPKAFEARSMRFEARTPRALFVVFANPSAEHEAEFNRWYDEIHGPDALENGSFTALHRFRAVGPGHRATPYLALWEAPYDSEAEAWAYIGPRAQALREAGRAGGEVASVRYALMMVGVSMEDGPDLDPVGALVTLQNDWRDTATAPTERTFWQRLPRAAVRAPVRWRVTSDAAGRGAGHHLAILAFPDLASARGAGFAEPGRGSEPGIADGMSPLPPYHTIFGTTVGHDEPGIPRSPAWRMIWEPVISQRA